MESQKIFYMIYGAAALIMLIYYIGRDKKIRSFLFGSLTGLGALMLINEYQSYIGVNIPLNLFNVSGSAVLGVPFVIMLVIIQQL